MASGRIVILTRGAAIWRPGITREDDDAFHGDHEGSTGSEAGVMPSTEMFAAMGRFNEEMIKGGVIHGPFAGDLAAGFWLIETGSLDEAVGWIRRAPFGPGDAIEIRWILAAEISARASVFHFGRLRAPVR
ncbi:YciI family protein [Rhodopseudomonas sp. HC1]|uniref:YciI family protein n=1 Tax=Rhodopseudomonas infernalis TaxID=2897386 RepID=UPI001EE7F377|nr:YciI family protein [Rhodopseudomonas infernalis]MCG6207099.1 YciI family protein [Rhodopseudomonas infernalis]